MDVSLFVELAERLALFGKITFCFLCPSSGGVARIFITGDELLALMPVLFGKIDKLSACLGLRWPYWRTSFFMLACGICRAGCVWADVLDLGR